MLVAAAEYLTYTEAVGLYQRLHDEAAIVSLVKNYAPAALPFGDGLYFRLLIEEEDAEAARGIVAEFEQRRSERAAVRCPRCGSYHAWPEPTARQPWYKRLFYAGTTLHRCQNCGEEFSA
jgi:DNA-directed RNA polymerase subunit RPC12/RpoP